MPGNFADKWRIPHHLKGPFTCRKSATWEFASELRHGEDFFRPEKSDGFGRVRTRELGYQRPACYSQITPTQILARYVARPGSEVRKTWMTRQAAIQNIFISFRHIPILRQPDETLAGLSNINSKHKTIFCDYKAWSVA
jgi:hypothetical protein